MNEQPLPPVYNVVGDQVALGPLRRDLVPLYARWLNDFAVTRTMGLRLAPVTDEAEEAWYDRMVASDTDVTFTIYERASARPIGSAGMHRVSHQHRLAEFGIVIGERDYWGRGYGTEATSLSLDYGFNALGLHCIFLRAYTYNARGLRAYEKAGFKAAGRLREAHWLAGKPYDIVFMDCLASEFESPVLKRLLDG